MFVNALETLSTGNLDWVKEKALKAAYELLAAKPELEGRLLTILVNKLGDPNRRVASKAGYLLSCLLTQHPLMGMVVVREVESFLFRCAPQALPSCPCMASCHPASRCMSPRAFWQLPVPSLVCRGACCARSRSDVKPFAVAVYFLRGCFWTHVHTRVCIEQSAVRGGRG